jgi:hypothetical protein
LCRKYRTVQQLSATSAQDVAARRRVIRRMLDDGMARIEAVLRPDEALLVMQAIEQVAKHASAGTFDRANGLVSLAQAVLRGDAPECTPVEIVVTIPHTALAASTAAEPGLDTVGVLADGSAVSAETCRRLACDAGLVAIIEDAAGQPLSVGRRTRTVPAAIKRALLHRDQTCRFPGCSNRLFLDAHHIHHWANGGETSLENTLLLCALCRARHKVHYAASLVMPRRGASPVEDRDLNAA